MRLMECALAMAAGLAIATAAAAAPAGKPYAVNVWSDVTFDGTGLAKTYGIVDEQALPAAFAEQVKARLRKARIEPRMVEGRPVEFRTGVMMAFEVTPGAKGGTVRLARLEMSPRPLKQSLAQVPKDIANSAGWTGQVAALCTVSVDGVCRLVDVEAVPGLPESARRWAVESMRDWRFEPQRLNGVAVEGEYRMAVSLEVEGPAYDDFRQDKFDRLMRSK